MQWMLALGSFLLALASGLPELQCNPHAIVLNRWNIFAGDCFSGIFRLCTSERWSRGSD
jgi:hypothetical protein